jgi:hypothetical protein
VVAIDECTKIDCAEEPQSLLIDRMLVIPPTVLNIVGDVRPALIFTNAEFRFVSLSPQPTPTVDDLDVVRR